MRKQDRADGPIDSCPSRHAGAPDAPPVPGRCDDVLPVRETVRTWALEALVAAYGGDIHRLLTDLADLVETSIAYVDRATVEAHLERPLSDDEWSAVAAEFSAMAFDEHVGDAGTFRTDWIEDRLHRAGVPGRTPPAPTALEPTRLPVRR